MIDSPQTSLCMKEHLSEVPPPQMMRPTHSVLGPGCYLDASDDRSCCTRLSSSLPTWKFSDWDSPDGGEPSKMLGHRCLEAGLVVQNLSLSISGVRAEHLYVQVKIVR